MAAKGKPCLLEAKKTEPICIKRARMQNIENIILKHACVLHIVYFNDSQHNVSFRNCKSCARPLVLDKLPAQLHCRRPPKNNDRVARGLRKKNQSSMVRRLGAVVNRKGVVQIWEPEIQRAVRFPLWLSAAKLDVPMHVIQQRAPNQKRPSATCVSFL